MSKSTTAGQLGAPASTATRTGRRPRRGVAATAALAAVTVTAAVVTSGAAALATAPTAHAEPLGPASTENVAARTAITELTPAAIPADFAASFGYHPTVVNGLLINPGGDCSSPVPLPAEFTTACQAHDVGYDLLRYANQRGEPLGQWARKDLDSVLSSNMHEACGTRDSMFSRARCHVMATIASTFVDLNSRRQGYGAPVSESWFGGQE